MAILDAFAELVGPRVIQEIRQVQAELLSNRMDDENPASFYRQLELDDHLSESFSSSSTPLGGIFGVGIWNLDDTPSEAGPALFMLGSADMRAPVELDDNKVASSILESRLSRFPADFTVVQLPPPTSQAKVGPGDSVSSMGTPGGLGVPVWTTNGGRGVTTAGHVARSVGAQVDLPGHGAIGYVETTDHPGLHGQGEECADLAVVALRSSVNDSSHNFSGLKNGTTYGRLNSITPSGRHKGWVRGVSDQWADTLGTGVWADVLISDVAISKSGDSGSAVVDDDDYVLGHVVAGADPAYSLIQDANYQLSKAGVRIRVP